ITKIILAVGSCKRSDQLQRPPQRNGHLLHYLKGLTEQSVNPEGQEFWDLRERPRALLTFANWGIWLASVAGGLIFAINWVAHGKTDVALCEYLVFIENFWSGKPLYVMNGLHGFHYLPV